MYTLGRQTGWWLLGMLCRLSLNPESCVVSSAASFYKRGRSILLICKFLPGLNTMATPLAGSMNLPLTQFLPLDLGGVVLYVAAYSVAGYLFSDFLGAIQKGYSTVGAAVGWLVGIVVLLWIAGRIRLWMRSRKEAPVTMVLATEIGENHDFHILDVRSHGYYDAKTERIKGSRRLEPNALSVLISEIPQDRRIVLYCTCLNEATAVKVARELKAKGFDPLVLSGGLRAWRQAGLPLEPVPENEVVPLPRFR